MNWAVTGIIAGAVLYLAGRWLTREQENPMTVNDPTPEPEPEAEPQPEPVPDNGDDD